MAKRLAGSQLNHENWDQEEETEQAGIFKKATDNEIAGRVIKKAARRRVNPMASEGDEAKKNAFSSFQGFSTKAAEGGNAFGFLQKGSTDSTKASTGGFSFGSSSGSDSSKPSFGSIGGVADAASKPSFVFGSSGTADPPKPAASPFSFGSIATSKDAGSSFGNSSAAPKSTFAFGSPSDPSKIAEPAKNFSFGSSTAAASPDAPKSTGTYVFGSASKPSAAASPTASFAFGSKKEETAVKPTFGSQTAANGNSDTAAAGGAPKGAKQEANGATAFGSSSTTFGAGGFKFGSSCDSGGGGGESLGSGKDKPAFSLGAGSTTSTGAGSSAVAGFKFGSGTTTGAEKSSSGGIVFGSAAKKEDSDKAFKIGGTDAKTSSTFSFGSSSTPPSAKSAATVMPVFGDKPSATVPQFGSPPVGDSSSGSAAAPMFSSGSTSDKKVDGFSSAGNKPVATGFAFGVKSDNSNSSDSSSSKLSSNAAFSFGAKSASGTDKKEDGSVKQISTSPVKSSTGDLEYTGEFLAHLQALNKQVTHWIQKHINDNSFIILSPVFKDYEKHLREITEKFPPKKKASVGYSFTSPGRLSSVSPATKFPVPSSSSSSSSTATPSFPIPPSSSPSATKFPLSATSSSPANTVKPFSFGGSSSSSASSTAAAVESKTEPVKPFSFGASATATSTEGVKPFSFGATADKPAAPPAAASGGFSFGLGKAAPAPGGGFTFGAGSMFSGPGGAGGAPAAAATDGGGEKEDEYEPPKAEVTQVEENDALYSKKCKLFYKKDQNYVEKGVGMLHLKPADNGKTQLLIRADTNLGNILLNIILNKDIPTTRVGKNNVMLVCVPNPPINPKDTGNEPVGMLIRVKTSDDADDLKTRLDDYKVK